MLHYKLIKLQHANLKREVTIVLGTIAGWHLSEATKSTHVYTTAGVFPAVESPLEIEQIIALAITPELETEEKK